MKEKKIKIIFIAMTMIIFSSVAKSDNAPFKIKDQPYINKNFEDLYFISATHNHDGSDSSKLVTVIPSSGSTYSLGSTTVPWKNVYASSSVGVQNGNFIANNGSFVCKTSSTGVVMKSENGGCWSIRIHNSGAIYSVSLPCPN